MKIIFATTNNNKINRLKNLLENTDIEILSLNNLPYKIKEPNEKGKTPSDIALNKALYYYEHLRDKIPVLTQDDTIQLYDINEFNQPMLSIKEPVIEKYGDFNDEFALKYYTKLASKYGGIIEMDFNYGFALVSENLQQTESAQLRCQLVNTISSIIQPGYFLSSIIKVHIHDKLIYYSELTNQEQRYADRDLARAVKALLKKLK